jgi:hypothetical protein
MYIYTVSSVKPPRWFGSSRTVEGAPEEVTDVYTDAGIWRAGNALIHQTHTDGLLHEVQIVDLPPIHKLIHTRVYRRYYVNSDDPLFRMWYEETDGMPEKRYCVASDDAHAMKSRVKRWKPMVTLHANSPKTENL